MPLAEQRAPGQLPYFDNGRADGLYISKLGAPHHFLASDAQRPTLIWARLSDKLQGFHIFSADLSDISHRDYYSLCELNRGNRQTVGPPGFNPYSGTKPFGKADKLMSKIGFSFLPKAVKEVKLKTKFSVGSGTEGSDPGGGLVVVKDFP